MGSPDLAPRRDGAAAAGAAAAASSGAHLVLATQHPAGMVSQRQHVLQIDLQRDGHLLVYGTSGSAKTSLLRRSPSLWPRAPTPTSGAVILGHDEERVRRLFTLLRRAIDERSRLFAEPGVSMLGE